MEVYQREGNDVNILSSIAFENEIVGIQLVFYVAYGISSKSKRIANLLFFKNQACSRFCFTSGRSRIILE